MSFLIFMENPDIVVVTGDTVSGYMWNGTTKDWYANVYKKFVKPLYMFNTPWAFTAGNHDSEGDLTRS